MLTQLIISNFWFENIKNNTTIIRFEPYEPVLMSIGCKHMYDSISITHSII